MEIAQLLLSLLHAWGLDPDLDLVCEGKLGLLRPMVPVSFGVLSKGGYMSLLLPTWQPYKAEMGKDAASALEANLPKEMVELERATRTFTAQTHWELSTTLTTNHLLAIIALANTLMSMNNASFVAEQERNRKLQSSLWKYVRAKMTSTAALEKTFVSNEIVLLERGAVAWSSLCWPNDQRFSRRSSAS
ncbi:WD repeat-containing protein 7 [Homalodisca vitripennis]|nr:WD repeat-containing protein 7 [Homalodisca vitripennis]